MICSFSTIDDQVLDQIKALETELDTSLLAFTCKDIKASSLKEDALNKIKELENKLGLSLVAVNV